MKKKSQISWLKVCSTKFQVPNIADPIPALPNQRKLSQNDGSTVRSSQLTAVMLPLIDMKNVSG